MTSERWQRIEALYHAARVKPPGERSGFLTAVCSDDEPLRREVEALLREPVSDEFLAEPALHLVSRIAAGPPPPVMTGQSLGGYALQSLLGAGGMGEVYRARDPKLGRDVAIKILSRTVSSSPDRLARFEREARMLAALNHPHICAIYGVEEADGVRFLILELIEGETLAERLARPASSAAISFADAVAIARQIANALEAAHEKGIVHRDLKPANVKITPDGTVKVLDFGLATATGAEPPAHNGVKPMIAGTAAYMSPEQAGGKDVDKRADIWAFGCVLYEMLTWRVAFAGETVSDTIRHVLERDPDWSALPSTTPLSVQRLLRRCLSKDPKRRVRDIGDVRLDLDTLDDAIPVPAESGTRALWLPWIAAGVLAGTLALTVARWAPWRAPQPAADLRLAVDLGAEAPLGTIDSQFGDAATVSPDGAVLAFVAQQGTERSPQLYVRRLNQLHAVALPGTSNAHIPFFSPDGQWVGFFAEGKVKKIAVTGGTAIVLSDAPEMRGGSWGEDGTIVFAPNRAAGTSLWRVPAAGGVATPITSLADGEAVHSWPQVLPGGAVLYTASGIPSAYNDANLVVQPPGAGPRVVQRGGYHGRYLPSGHLVYIHDGTLYAVPFDLGRLTTTGSPVPALEGVASNALTGGAQFAASAVGTLVFRQGPMVGAGLPLSWMTREGKLSMMRAEAVSWFNPRFSPDGGRLALEIREGLPDIWVYDWSTDKMSRLGTDIARGATPVWTPDGQRIAFSSSRADTRVPNLYWKRADGQGGVQRLTDSPHEQHPASWHPNGRFLAFEEDTPEALRNVMILPLDGDERSGWKPGKPTAFLSTPTNEGEPMFSPDGR